MLFRGVFFSAKIGIYLAYMKYKYIRTLKSIFMQRGK